MSAVGVGEQDSAADADANPKLSGIRAYAFGCRSRLKAALGGMH